jgi:exonuclease-1
MASSNATRVSEDSTSRFFGASPSLRKASSKKDNFELWSDDSAHEAIAALADTPAHSPSPKKRKRLSVFSDASPADLRSRDGNASQDLTQDTVSSFASSISRDSKDTDTPATSFGSISDSPNIFSKGINLRFDGLKSKWAYNPEITNAQPQKKAAVPDNTATKTPSLTEEGHDSILATETFAKSDEIIPASSPVAPRDLEEDTDDRVLSDDDWLALEQEPATASIKSQITAQGSEDLLIPESPRSNSYEGEARSSLDLGRFAFTG